MRLQFSEAFAARCSRAALINHTLECDTSLNTKLLEEREPVCRFDIREIASRAIPVVFTLAALAFGASNARSQEEHEHGHGLHFAHPLYTESISPDTKIRANTGREWETDGDAWELELEGEYAFRRSFSIEAGIPYIILRPTDVGGTSGPGNLEILFKFANYAFEEQGLLLGYGVQFGVPTGDAANSIGSDHIWEVAPVLNLGYKHGAFELVGFTIFGIPFGQESGEEVETEFTYNGSVLMHASPQFQFLVELNGNTVLSGEERGTTLVRLSPGVKVAPSRAVPLFIGLGATLPLTQSELNAGALASLFYHF